ncbi:MipA/OmpV family protein [Zobellella iuensis]|uniref:MipA/OmpV family protein n=1 Tax=Zobellella iuensis TaxID=2803811 RepID=A0ABS1QQL2_9GAMM|nr:MipA/OmpV family protein [Zobellella iuensis]MBL1377156.1 MipA/OmpV family protein [Zobellella iuensis]
MSRTYFLPALLLLPLAAPPVLAQQGWSGSIGAGALVAPDYLGSDNYKTRAVPDANLTYGDLFYVSWRDGLGWNLFQYQGFSLSPFIGYHPGRDNTGDLSRFDKVKGGATAGLRLGYRQGPWRYQLEGHTAATGDVDGYQLSFTANWREQLAPDWSVRISPSLTYSSSEWTRDMFGISVQEAARSGLSAYRPDDGYWRLGLSGSLNYRFATDWSVTGITGLTRLTGDAKDSPIVSRVGDATQAITGLLVSYHF